MGAAPAARVSAQMPMSEMQSSMVDVGFAVGGAQLAADHRRMLAQAVEGLLPWLAGLPGAAVHRLRMVPGGAQGALLSRRTRLTLRVPRERASDVQALAGSLLCLGDQALSLGPAQLHELLPHNTLYAYLVAWPDADEAAFILAMNQELSILGVACRPICGRHQVVEGGAIEGFSLMLDGLSVAHSLRVLESGLGPHRRLGCGVFVPHKSATAVGG